jgi:transposase
MVHQALSKLWRDFEAMYAKEGLPPIAPAKLLRALLLQVLYTRRTSAC